MESSGSSIEEKAGQSVAPVQRLASISRRSAAAFARRGSGAADRRPAARDLPLGTAHQAATGAVLTYWRRGVLPAQRTGVLSVDLTCQITGVRIVKEDAEGSADSSVMHVAATHCFKIGIVEDADHLDLRVEIGGHVTAPVRFAGVRRPSEGNRSCIGLAGMCDPGTTE
jgi:hypothetical protein